MSKRSWTQPICERCWIERNTAIVDGQVTLRAPHFVRDSGLRMCAFCGQPTLVGIFVRHDPDLVPWPAYEDD